VQSAVFAIAYVICLSVCGL